MTGFGECTRAAASARIQEGAPYASGVERHEVGHISHHIRDGAARLTPRARKDLSRLYSEGGYRLGASLLRDALHANGTEAYKANGASAQRPLARAPTAAALLRRHVNEHPVPSQFYQMKSLVPFGLLGAGFGVGLLGQPEGEDQ